MGGLFDAFVSYKSTTREDMILPHPQLFLDNDELNAGLYEGEVISQQGIKATWWAQNEICYFMSNRNMKPKANEKMIE